MKPISSVITGPPNPGPQAASSTGAGRGETGSAVTSTAAETMHPAVVCRTPQANTEAVLSSMRRSGLDCVVKTETVFPTTEDGDQTFRQRPVSLTVTTGSSVDYAAGLRAIEESLKPASRDQIEVWLGEVAAKTARRSGSEADADVTFGVYVRDLKAYPADVVRHVLQSWRGKWWPTWGDLADRLDELTDPRLMIRDRVKVLTLAKAEETASTSREDALREEIAALRRLMQKYPELQDAETRAKAERLEAELSKLGAARG